MDINRTLENTILKYWDSGKVIIVLGARQVGKTTLLNKICQQKGDFLFLSGDDIQVRTMLENAGLEKLRQIIGNSKTVFIDEAQRIKNIGLTLKIIHDQMKQVRLLVSGSSSFDIANEINEPLTGRKWELNLWPISWKEYVNSTNFMSAYSDLPNRLVFGMYPEVLNNKGNEKAILNQLSGSYLYKDLLNYKGIRNPEVLEKLLIALALQLGSEVNYNELSNLLQIDRATVENYIRLLEMSFVVFKLQSFSRNQRNEIKQSRKVYFYDNGIRNSLISNYSPLELRNDVGALWENFVIAEKLKSNSYNFWHGNTYFWRTYQQQEIDYIEEIDGKINAFEIKWNPQKKVKKPSSFLNSYSNSSYSVINRENFNEFLE